MMAKKFFWIRQTLAITSCNHKVTTQVASHQATGAMTCPTCFQTIANPLRETAIALRQIGKGLQMFAV